VALWHRRETGAARSAGSEDAGRDPHRHHRDRAGEEKYRGRTAIAVAESSFVFRHARACPGHPRLRASATSKKWMAGKSRTRTLPRHARACPGHDGVRGVRHLTQAHVMRGHSRPKDGVLSHTYDPRIHDASQARAPYKLCRCGKSSWIAGSSPAMTDLL